MTNERLDKSTEEFLAQQLEDEMARHPVTPITPPVRPSARTSPSGAHTSSLSGMANPLGQQSRYNHSTVRQGSVKGYEQLDRILNHAYAQAADGKGKERHAMSPVGFQPWDQQPILANARQVGPGGLAQQVMKKAGESTGMAGRKDFAGAKAEALGAIVYAAALYKLYEEMEEAGRYT